MIFGQYSTGIDRLRFISLAVDGPLSMTRAKAVGPPKASMRSGTDCMSNVLQNFCCSCQQDFCEHIRHNFCMDETSGDRLTRARLRAGFPKRPAACKRFDWNPSTYASHENGQTPVPAEDAKEYAKAYDVTPEWIVFGVGDINDPAIDHLLRDRPPKLVKRARRLIEALLEEDEL